MNILALTNSNTMVQLNRTVVGSHSSTKIRLNTKAQCTVCQTWRGNKFREWFSRSRASYEYKK